MYKRGRLFMIKALNSKVRIIFLTGFALRRSIVSLPMPRSAQASHCAMRSSDRSRTAIFSAGIVFFGRQAEAHTVAGVIF